MKTNIYNMNNISTMKSINDKISTLQEKCEDKYNINNISTMKPINKIFTYKKSRMHLHVEISPKVYIKKIGNWCMAWWQTIPLSILMTWLGILLQQWLLPPQYMKAMAACYGFSLCVARAFLIHLHNQAISGEPGWTHWGIGAMGLPKEGWDPLSVGGCI